MTTLFEKIIKREIPAEIVLETDNLIVIKDIHPVAPVHLLIITKKPIADLQSMDREDLPLIQEIITMAQTLAEQFGITEGYRLLTNSGTLAGQTIFHLHFHLIGGRQLGHMA